MSFTRSYTVLWIYTHPHVHDCQEIERLTIELSRMRAACQVKDTESDERFHSLARTVQSLSDTFQRLMLKGDRTLSQPPTQTEPTVPQSPSNSASTAP